MKFIIFNREIEITSRLVNIEKLDHEFPEDWQEIAWAKLPPELRGRAILHLHSSLPASFFKDVRKRYVRDGLPWWPSDWHFGQGMAIRNLLREVIRDEELPPLPEVYGSDHGGNWDDYYIAVVEAAAGIRPH